MGPKVAKGKRLQFQNHVLIKLIVCREKADNKNVKEPIIIYLEKKPYGKQGTMMDKNYAEWAALFDQIINSFLRC